MADQFTFEWDGSPPVESFADVVELVEISDDVGRVRIEIEAESLAVGDVGAADGSVLVEALSDDGSGSTDGGPVGNLSTGTKAFWVAVAMYDHESSWFTADELAELVAADGELDVNRAYGYLRTLQDNGLVTARKRSTGERGSDPSEFRLVEGTTAELQRLAGAAGETPSEFDPGLGGVVEDLADE